MARRAKYAIALAIGLALSLSVAAGRGAFDQGDAARMWQYLSDGFFAAAVLLLGVGLLIFVASDGLFDMLGFGAKKVLSLMSRDESRLSGTFYDFKAMRQAKGRGGYGFLVVTGALFLAAAAACLLMYAQAA